MTRLPSIAVTKISTTDYKATIHWSNKNLDNKLPFIMTRLPSNEVKINHDNRLHSIMTRLPTIRVIKITKKDYLP